MQDRDGARGTRPPVVDRAAEDRAERCARCDRPIDTRQWYPIRAREDEEGVLRIYPFCSEACRLGWDDAAPAGSS